MSFPPGGSLAARMKRYSSRWLATLLLLTVVYVAAGKLGLRFAFENPSASPIWPPTGIAIAALLVLGLDLWPAVLLGAFVVNATTAGNLFTAVGIASGNTLEAVVAAALVRRFADRPDPFARPRGVLAQPIDADARHRQRLLVPARRRQRRDAGPVALGHEYLAQPDRSFTVPRDGYFALGDNSYNSYDSRYWGAVPDANLVGRGLFVYWPFNRHWGLIR